MADCDGGGCGSSAEPRLSPRALVYLALMVLIGSSTAPAARLAARELPTGLLPLVRFGVAGLILAPLVVLNGRGRALLRLFAADGPRLLVAAALCVPVNQAFFLNATQLTPTSHVGLIYASVPLVVLLLAAALGQERLVPARLVGVALSVLGVMVIGLEGLLSPGGALGPNTFRGDLLLVGAILSWGGYLTASKPLIARHGALPVLAGTFLAGALLDLPLALFTAPGWAPLSAASATAWWAAAYLTFVVTVLGLAFQNLALRRLDASQVATFGNAAPVLTLVWGFLLFGEQFSPALILGGVLTLGGILWTTRPARERAARRVRAAAVPPA